VAENSYGINISDRSYITVQNINFAYIHYGVFAYQSAAVSSGIVLTNNTYTRCRAGVLLSTANANTFTGNFITHSVFTECSAGIKCDTRVSSGDISTGVHTGYEITDNEFYNTGYASGSSGQWDTLIAGSADQECIGMQNTQSSIIARNKMVNGYTKGIYLYIRETGSVLNNTVTRNLFKNLAGDTALTIAGSLSGAELSNNVITYNIFDTCTGSFVLWFMNVVSPAATYNIIQNNTFYKGATAIYCPYSASNANAGEYYKILNNIFDQQSSYFVFLGSDPTNFDCDYSLYSTVTGNKWAWDNNAKSWAQWAAYGHDDHTLTAVSPYFVNQYEDKFRLQSVSPAIDVGVAHSYVYDFHGNVVTGLTEDIGACECVTDHPLRFD
jgi:parallel beta-helix repeat protein